MRASSAALIVAVAGALLLSWRVGSAIGAEIAYEPAGDYRVSLPWNLWFFGAGAAIPAMQGWIIASHMKRPVGRNSQRLAIAAAVGVLFVPPAILHQAGVIPSGAPSILWAIGAFLAYRYWLGRGVTGKFAPLA